MRRHGTYACMQKYAKCSYVNVSVILLTHIKGIPITSLKQLSSPHGGQTCVCLDTVWQTQVGSPSDTQQPQVL